MIITKLKYGIAFVTMMNVVQASQQDEMAGMYEYMQQQGYTASGSNRLWCTCQTMQDKTGVYTIMTSDADRLKQQIYYSYTKNPRYRMAVYPEFQGKSALGEVKGMHIHNIGPFSSDVMNGLPFQQPFKVTSPALSGTSINTNNTQRIMTVVGAAAVWIAICYGVYQWVMHEPSPSNKDKKNPNTKLAQ